MKVAEWEIDKIRPYENNPRQNEDAVDKVAASIKEFGWQQPIVVDTEGVIIAGHTRWKAAKKLGLAKVPVKVAEGLSAEEIKRLCESEVDLLMTDPPYNIALGKNIDMPSTAKQLHRRTDGLTIENDSMPEEEFLLFLRAAFEAANGCMRPGAAYYIWHASNQTAAFQTAARLAGMPMREVLIWVKSEFAMGRQDYQWKHESCIYGWKTGAAHYFVDDRTQSTVFEDARPDFNKMKKDEMRQLLEDIYSDKVSTTVIHEKKPGRSELHPTVKPVPLIGRLIKNSTKKGETILDPFGGSGTTMIAAEQLGRRCYMAEIDTHYADVIIDRWQTFTGGQAEEIDG